MVCVLKVSSTLLFILIHARFGTGIFGNHREPRQYAAMQPLEQGGPERRCWGCRCTPGTTAPGLAQLATALLWWAVGWARVAPPVVLGPSFVMKVGFSISFIAYFCIMLFELRLLSCFPLVFKCMSCKTCFFQYKWG